MRWVLLYAVPFWVARALALGLFHQVSGGGGDLASLVRGVLSDLATGALFALFSRVLGRRDVLRAAWWGLGAVLAAVNIEHIAVHAANLDFANASLAFRREFILGSVLSRSLLAKASVCLVLSVGAALALLWRRPIRRAPLWVEPLLVGLFLLPTTSLAPRWVQQSVVEGNLRGVLGSSRGGPGVEGGPEALSRYLHRDLDGEPILALPVARTNVILLVLEGINGDLSVSEAMPNLRTLGSAGLAVDSFVSLQHQTDRGLYALLCGDLPNLVEKEAKSDLVGMHDTDRTCLPELFERAGYRTEFMQGAPLGYMRKDRFCRQIGFDRALGDRDYPHAFGRSPWGVDDRTLFQHVLSEVARLREEPQPWVLTVLTVGTHHPYIVPEDVPATKEGAIRYLDEALGELYRGLEESGVLRDTTLIVTADEASFVETTTSGLAMGSAHAPLVVVGPEVPGALVQDQVFTQADLLLSVADLLGLDSSGLTGRSFFRRYPSGRDLLFANVLAARLFSWTATGTLYYCNTRFRCSALEPEDRRLFSRRYREVPVDPAYVELMRSAVRANDRSSRDVGERYAYLEEDAEYSGNFILVGDQKMTLRQGEALRWELDIEARDPVVLDLLAVSYTEHRRIEVFKDEISLAPGQRWQGTKSYVAERDEAWVWTLVSAYADPAARYRVNRLSIERLPADGAKGP